jgi:hypothetical protein
MKIIMIFIVHIAILSVCFAGSYWPKENDSFIIQLSDNLTYYKLQKSDLNWQKQLLNKIHFEKFKSKGGTYKTFVLSNYTLNENGKTSSSVYVNLDNNSELLVYTESQGEFFIKIKEQAIIWKYLGGISLHMHPSKKAVTILIPEGGEIIGVEAYTPTLRPNVKPATIFKKKSIEWH